MFYSITTGLAETCWNWGTFCNILGQKTHTKKSCFLKRGSQNCPSKSRDVSPHTQQPLIEFCYKRTQVVLESKLNYFSIWLVFICIFSNQILEVTIPSQTILFLYLGYSPSSISLYVKTLLLHLPSTGSKLYFFLIHKLPNVLSEIR